MKVWKVYLTDYPEEPLIVRADNYTKMKLEVHKYIKQWDLDAEIDRVVEVE